MRSLTGRQGPCKSSRGGLLQGDSRGPIRHRRNAGGRMADFYRLIRLAFFALFLLPSLSHAVLPKVTEYQGQKYASAMGSTGWSTSKSEACKAVVDYLTGVAGGTRTYAVTAYDPTCTWSMNGSPWDASGYLTRSTCPANSVESGGSCLCASPMVEVGGSCQRPACPGGQHEEGGACVPNSCLPEQTRVNGLCVDPPPCGPGETRVNGVCQKSNCKAGATGGYYELTSISSVATCSHDGAGSYCSMIIEWQMTAQFDGGARYYGIGRLTGSSCAPAPDGPGSPTPTDPAKPNDPNAPKPTQPDPTKPGSQPGGSPGTPGGGSAPNTDGTCPSGSYKSGGSCYPNNPPPVPPDNDGKCPAGTVKVGATCAVLQPAPDQKPDDKKPSIFGGACNAVACEGDAIQCAIARDQYRRSCELMDKESAESALYGANKGKEGNQTADLPGNETISLESRIDTSDALGAGASGVSDLSVTVWNQSVTLPFSQINPYLAHLGSVLLAVSFLMAVRIVGRG